MTGLEWTDKNLDEKNLPLKLDGTKLVEYSKLSKPAQEQMMAAWAFNPENIKHLEALLTTPVAIQVITTEKVHGEDAE